VRSASVAQRLRCCVIAAATPAIRARRPPAVIAARGLSLSAQPTATAGRMFQPNGSSYQVRGFLVRPADRSTALAGPPLVLLHGSGRGFLPWNFSLVPGYDFVRPLPRWPPVPRLGDHAIGSATRQPRSPRNAVMHRRSGRHNSRPDRPHLRPGSYTTTHGQPFGFARVALVVGLSSPARYRPVDSYSFRDFVRGRAVLGPRLVRDPDAGAHDFAAGRVGPCTKRRRVIANGAPGSSPLRISGSDFDAAMFFDATRPGGERRTSCSTRPRGDDTIIIDAIKHRPSDGAHITVRAADLRRQRWRCSLPPSPAGRPEHSAAVRGQLPLVA